MGRKIVLVILMTLHTVVNMSQETPNERQARRIFNETYNMVFGPEGATLQYDVNIVGIYKTRGTIWYKGKKQKFVDERITAWNDGKTAYMAYRKKKEVQIHEAASDRKDKYSGTVKFALDDCTYHISEANGMFLLTLKQKKNASGTIKTVKAWVRKGSYEPVRLRIKVAFFWTTVNISHFRSGGISDDLFVFPRSQFKNW